MLPISAVLASRKGEPYEDRRDADAELPHPFAPADAAARTWLCIAPDVHLGCESESTPFRPVVLGIQADEITATGIVIRAVEVEERRRLRAYVELLALAE